MAYIAHFLLSLTPEDLPDVKLLRMTARGADRCWASSWSRLTSAGLMRVAVRSAGAEVLVTEGVLRAGRCSVEGQGSSDAWSSGLLTGLLCSDVSRGIPLGRQLGP